MNFKNYSVIALAVCATFTVHAEVDSQLANFKDIERVIVTGSRIEESLDEVPASVSIIDNKTLTQDLLTSAEIQTMLALHVPGMGAANTGTNTNSGQSLRGRSALVMIDGVPQSTPLRNGKLGIRSLDPSVIERIEVIKGATSIYGNGAAGGIINYITKTASSEKALSGRVAVSSSFSTVKFEDSAGRRIETEIDGTLGDFDYVVSAVSDESGVVRDAQGDALGLTYGLSNFKSDNLFTKFNYYIDDLRSLQFSYNYFEGQQDSDYIAVEGNVNSGIKRYAIEKPYSDYKQMLADPNIDIIYIATPHNFHYQQAKMCLEAGKHVLVEKPCTVNAAQMQALVALSKCKKLLLQEALWSRFMPCLSQLRQVLKEGLIGQIQYIQSDIGFAFQSRKESRLHQAELAGGSLLDLGIYSISVSQFLLEEHPDSINAIGQASIGSAH